LNYFIINQFSSEYPSNIYFNIFIPGFDTIFYPIKEGRRHGVYAAYVDPAMLRPTLVVRKYAYVKRVLIDENKRAYGVEYDHHGRPNKALATKEVIISAGAMNSPKILMLSGVGPKNDLLKLGVTYWPCLSY